MFFSKVASTSGVNGSGTSKVVVEAVDDGRPDAQPGGGDVGLDGLREDVRRRVPDDRTAEVGVGQDRFDDVAVGRDVREVARGGLAAGDRGHECGDDHVPAGQPVGRGEDVGDRRARGHHTLR